MTYQMNFITLQVNSEASQEIPGRLCLIGDGAKGVYNGLTVLPNEGSQKASDKTDSKSC